MNTKMTEEEYRNMTMAHIAEVTNNLRIARNILFERGIVHDLSKFSPEESETYRKYIPLLESVEYNGKEYKDALKGMDSGLQHHYAHNPHHPEHYQNGVNDMSIFDILEMLMDWKTSIESKGLSFEDGVIINIDRFNIQEPLKSIVLKTAHEIIDRETLEPEHAKIISGFPGVGKSTAIEKLKESGKKVCDHESSDYSWVVLQDGTKERNPEFPTNYVMELRELIKEYDYVFISSHDIVLMMLLSTPLSKYVTIVSPTDELKDVFIKRYHERKSPQGLIDTINNDWKFFIRSIELFEELGIKTIWIDEDNVFISDLVDSNKI